MAVNWGKGTVNVKVSPNAKQYMRVKNLPNIPDPFVSIVQIRVNVVKYLTQWKL